MSVRTRITALERAVAQRAICPECGPKGRAFVELFIGKRRVGKAPRCPRCGQPPSGPVVEFTLGGAARGGGGSLGVRGGGRSSRQGENAGPNRIRNLQRSQAGRGPR